MFISIGRVEPTEAAPKPKSDRDQVQAKNTSPAKCVIVSDVSSDISLRCPLARRQGYNTDLHQSKYYIDTSLVVQIFKPVSDDWTT
jgi:hypothetical protein